MDIPLKQKKKFLIQHLISSGYLKTKKVIQAFEEIPRENFVPHDYHDHAYADEPLPIGGGQTISAPHMVAVMTELLEPKKTDEVLEVGAGSGYQAAILSKLVKKVFTIEFDKNIAKRAELNLCSTGINNVEIMTGDGSKGYEKQAPFDKTIVTCACQEIPRALIVQLKEGGRIVIPVGGQWYQELVLGVKKKGRLETSMHGGCVFVPLRH